MPFTVKKVGNKWKLYNEDKKAFAKASFNAKQAAINQAKNWMRYAYGTMKKK